jgi:hypothetical protein
MKNTTLFLLGMITLFGCEEIDELTQFQMDYEANFTVEAATDLSVPFEIGTPDIPTHSVSTFAANETRKDLVEEIKLTKLDLFLESPEKSDLGFLKSIEVFIQAEGQEETRIAWVDEVPDTVGDYLPLNVSNTDLKEYITPDNFSLRVATVTDELFTTDHEIKIESSFFVDAKILGQ